MEEAVVEAVVEADVVIVVDRLEVAVEVCVLVADWDRLVVAVLVAVVAVFDWVELAVELAVVLAELVAD